MLNINVSQIYALKQKESWLTKVQGMLTIGNLNGDLNLLGPAKKKLSPVFS